MDNIVYIDQQRYIIHDKANENILTLLLLKLIIIFCIPHTQTNRFNFDHPKQNKSTKLVFWSESVYITRLFDSKKHIGAFNSLHRWYSSNSAYKSNKNPMAKGTDESLFSLCCLQVWFRLYED